MLLAIVNLRCAISLIELLVVIAIIGFPAPVLIPALNKSKNSAGKVTDLNNLRQIIVALNVYAPDNFQLLFVRVSELKYRAKPVYSTVNPTRKGAENVSVET